MPEMITPDRVRPIRQEDDAKLRTLLGLKDFDELPEGVVESYWQHIRLWQRLGYSAGASDALLVSIVVHGKATAPAIIGAPWIVQAVRDKTVEHDALVKVRIGNTKKSARFRLLTAGNDRARVHVEGDADERLIPVADVLGVA